MTHLCDGSVFFGLLPRKQPAADVKKIVMQMAEDEIKRVNVAPAEAQTAAGSIAAPPAMKVEHLETCTPALAGGDDDDGRGDADGAHERVGTLQAPARESPVIIVDVPDVSSGLTTASAALNGADDGANRSHPDSDSQSVPAAAGFCASDAAAHSSNTVECGPGTDACHTNALPLRGAVESEHETPAHIVMGGGRATDAQDLITSAAPSLTSSSAPAAAESLLPARQLRPARVPASSPTASSFKTSRNNTDSLLQSHKVATPQVELDNVFIRSAVAPAMECFNPVFHFQR